MGVWESPRGGCEVVRPALGINLVLLQQKNEARVYARERG